MNYNIYVRGAKIGLRKRLRGSDTFKVFRVLVWMCRQMMVIPMCMHSCFPARRSEQTIVMSFHDITRISCAIEEGNYKRRAQLNLGAVVWVFWYQAFGSINKPQTLYLGCLSASCGRRA